MIATTSPEHHRTTAVPFVGLEVATLSSDQSRASVHVIGDLLPNTAPLLISVLRTHIAGGRRYLRVDLAAARVTDAEVIDALIEARRCITALGGTVVFENAGPRIVDAIRRATLNVRSEQLSAAS